MSRRRVERPWLLGVAALALVAAVLPTAAAAEPDLAVVVRGAGGDVGRATAAVDGVGGVVRRHLGIVGGVVATIPARALDQLAAAPTVASVTPDDRIDFHAVAPALGDDAAADFGALQNITKIVGAQDSWKAGYTGRGIDIALIDTGVSPVAGLTSGNVLNGPDLSFDSQDPTRTNLDGYGHGTHMASLIVGRDRVDAASAYAAPGTFTGVAPDARLVSVKVGAVDGATDVSQVIAAIEWVVQHAKTDGLNIRVLSLSFGTDGTQDAALDPLVYAAEVAWRAGIVVVVSGGNDGSTTRVLANPARSGLVLAVGASDPMGTLDPVDDTVPPFATRGEASRHVDLVAPGVHVLGLRSPGSTVDLAHPGARVGTRFFRGSGTSQAAAIAAGAAALLVQRHPTANPDQVKAMLTQYAVPLRAVSTLYRGNGSLQVRRAQAAKLSARVAQASLPGSGTGTLEGARGSAHVADRGVDLVGEQDIFGAPWDARGWGARATSRTNWVAGRWNGNDWTGSPWAGASWTGRTWGAATWSGRTWTGGTWTDEAWAGRTWTSAGWDGGAWSGRTWTGRTWTGASWSTDAWG